MYITKFLKAINFTVSEGSKFLWSCFGDDAYFYDYGNDDPNYDISCIFDKITEEIYMISIYDYYLVF